MTLHATLPTRDAKNTVLADVTFVLNEFISEVQLFGSLGNTFKCLLN